MQVSAPAVALPVPEGLRREESYASSVRRLSELSVRKFHDPYRDVAWDAPENRIEPGDPRLAIDDDHPLAQTRWYRALDPDARSRFGAEWLAQALKYAIGFEAVLSRGLLMIAQDAQNRTPELRYALHEVVEEARHSMMFQELIDRLGADPKPRGPFARWLDDRVAVAARSSPELFFFAALSGEIFIDRQNREQLRRPAEQLHPLVRRVMQIHVLEEARHVCFAERYLQEHLPRIGTRKRLELRAMIPTVLATPHRVLMIPTRQLAKRFAIPRSALREAFGPGTAHRHALVRTAEPLRALAEAHGVWWPAAWRAAGVGA